MVNRVNLDWSPQTMGTILLRVMSRVPARPSLQTRLVPKCWMARNGWVALH